jgi:hypothetical protein
MSGGIVLLMLAPGLTGFGGSSSLWAPVAPSQPSAPRPTPIQAVCTDPRSGFSTSDVRDAQEQIVRFTSAPELIWITDGTTFPGYPVKGNLITADINRFFYLDVRFGTKDGEQRAYLTWYDDYNHYYPGTIVDLEVVGGHLVIAETHVTVPGT